MHRYLPEIWEHYSYSDTPTLSIKEPKKETMKMLQRLPKLKVTTLMGWSASHWASRGKLWNNAIYLFTQWNILIFAGYVVKYIIYIFTINSSYTYQQLQIPTTDLDSLQDTHYWVASSTCTTSDATAFLTLISCPKVWSHLSSCSLWTHIALCITCFTLLPYFVIILPWKCPGPPMQVEWWCMWWEEV